MATRVWTGGTGTWDATTGTNWVGGVAPIAGDNVTFDGSSGGGTVTVDSSVANIVFGILTAGAFTGTLAFNTNNPNMAFSSVAFGGSGTRTINMGSGTWTLSGTTFNPAEFDVSTVTGLTPTFQNAALVFNGNSVSRSFGGGGQTFGSLTINNNTTKGMFSFTGANTFASVTAGSGNTLLFPQGTTTTITGALAITGTAAAPSGVESAGPTTNVTTISVGSASTPDWCAFLRVTKTGAGSITATNSFDLGGNTSITIGAPSGGGGGGQRVISG